MEVAVEGVASLRPAASASLPIARSCGTTTTVAVAPPYARRPHTHSIAGLSPCGCMRVAHASPKRLAGHAVNRSFRLRSQAWELERVGSWTQIEKSEPVLYMPTSPNAEERAKGVYVLAYHVAGRFQRPSTSGRLRTTSTESSSPSASQLNAAVQPEIRLQ